MTDKPSQRLGKYQILEEIGRGANAVVYKARHTALERVDALKVMRPGLLWEEEAVQRFLREARAAASLDHPHIVPIYDVGEEQGTYYITMKYLPGRTVDQLIQERGPLPVDEALNIALQVADALAYAHQRGFVHRDIKPANIIVDERGHATLTDFGLAKALEWASMTGSTGVVGTPAYIPPEVWEGKKATPASDVYSLGCVLWEMLAGRALFEGDTPPAVMRGHLMEPPPPLEEVRPQVPKGIAQVVRRALAKAPEERYGDAAAFAAALQEIAEPGIVEEPAPIRPPSPPAVSRQPSRPVARTGQARKWRLLGVLGAVLVTAVLFWPRREPRLETVVAVLGGAPISGSGTIVDSRGLILTADSVRGGAEAPLVGLITRPEVPLTTWFQTRVVVADATLNLAVLVITQDENGAPVRGPLNLPALSRGDSDKLVEGDRLKVIGYPAASPPVRPFNEIVRVQDAVVSRFPIWPDGTRQWVELDRDIGNFSYQGGAVLNERHELVGIPQPDPTAPRLVQPINLAEPIIRQALVTLGWR